MLDPLPGTKCFARPKSITSKANYTEAAANLYNNNQLPSQRHPTNVIAGYASVGQFTAGSVLPPVFSPSLTAKSFGLPAPQGTDHLKQLKSLRPASVFCIHTFRHPDNICGTISQNEVVKFNPLGSFGGGISSFRKLPNPNKTLTNPKP